MTLPTSGALEPAEDAPEEGETIVELARATGFRVELVSSGVVDTPVEFLQAHAEWVAVLTGFAILEIGGEEHRLEAGDWVLIPASTGHRLLHVTPGTRWLAVHDRPPGT